MSSYIMPGVILNVIRARVSTNQPMLNYKLKAKEERRVRQHNLKKGKY